MMNEDYPEIDFADIRVGDTVERRCEFDDISSIRRLRVARRDDDTLWTGHGALLSGGRALGAAWHLIHRPEPEVVLPQEPTRGVARLKPGFTLDGITHGNIAGFVHVTCLGEASVYPPNAIESFTPTIAVPKAEWEKLVEKGHLPVSLVSALADLIAATERLHGDGS